MHNENKQEVYLDLKILFYAIYRQKYLVLTLLILSIVASLHIAISQPNIYTSSVILSPTSNNVNQNSSSLSAAAVSSITGLGITSEISKSTEAIERIQSLDFFTNYFMPEIYLENLMAFKEWIPIENKVIYNNELFDADKNIWIRDVSYPRKVIPSAQESYISYKNILNVSQDKKTSLIKISISHPSPTIAANWVEIIVKKINDSMRDEDKNSAKRAIDFLNTTASLNKLINLKESLSNIQEDQVRKYMLASVNEDYIFKVIDSPAIPEYRSSPNRMSIAVIGTLIGAFFSILAAFMIDLVNSRIKQKI